HSCVLRARSTYFHSALSSDWVKTDGNFIVFEKSNISPEVFQMILRYLYSGTINLENQHPTRIMDLLAAADELILTELVNYLKDYLLTYYDKWIRQHPLQILYHIAFRLDSCKDLQDICLKYICENPTSVADTGEIIGGYNPESWKGGFFGHWTKSLDSFIFSLGVE
ncbi:10750_t:CDS:2, partial [Scutellospora calospora]